MIARKVYRGVEERLGKGRSSGVFPRSGNEVDNGRHHTPNILPPFLFEDHGSLPGSQTSARKEPVSPAFTSSVIRGNGEVSNVEDYCSVVRLSRVHKGFYFLAYHAAPIGRI